MVRLLDHMQNRQSSGEEPDFWPAFAACALLLGNLEGLVQIYVARTSVLVFRSPLKA